VRDNCTASLKGQAVWKKIEFGILRNLNLRKQKKGSKCTYMADSAVEVHQRSEVLLSLDTIHSLVRYRRSANTRSFQLWYSAFPTSVVRGLLATSVPGPQVLKSTRQNIYCTRAVCRKYRQTSLTLFATTRASSQPVLCSESWLGCLLLVCKGVGILTCIRIQTICAAWSCLNMRRRDPGAVENETCTMFMM
jgi:hypothetical protein